MSEAEGEGFNMSEGENLKNTYRLFARRVLIYEQLLSHSASPGILDSAIDLIHKSIVEIMNFDPEMFKQELEEELLSSYLQKLPFNCDTCCNTGCERTIFYEYDANFLCNNFSFSGDLVEHDAHISPWKVNLLRSMEFKYGIDTGRVINKLQKDSDEIRKMKGNFD